MCGNVRENIDTDSWDGTPFGCIQHIIVYMSVDIMPPYTHQDSCDWGSVARVTTWVLLQSVELNCVPTQQHSRVTAQEF